MNSMVCPSKFVTFFIALWTGLLVTLCFYEYNNYYYLIRSSEPSDVLEKKEILSNVIQTVSQEDSFQKQLMDIKQKIKPIRLLVIAFPRSGSSLAGSILSAGTNTAYYYEPFHWQVFKHPNGTGVDLHFVKVDDKFISGYTNGLFECNRPAIVRLGYHTNSIVEKYERCYQSEKVLIKAIRLHANNMLPWIIDEDIKVIQLIRDPRAILNSQFKAREMFKEWTYHVDSLCKMMMEDDNLSQHLPSNRFAQLKYEELVTNPVVTLTKLYQKLDLDVDLNTIKSALKHLDEVPEVVNQNKNNYMSVYRGPDHEMNAWQHGIKKDELAEIETKCKSTLEYFGYELSMKSINSTK